MSADGRETGGILLGHDDGVVITLTVAGDPGPLAARRADGFLRDLQHAQDLADEAYDRDGSVWVGEWHTHPTGPSTPSTRDVSTYAQLLADQDLLFDRVVSLIITPGPDGWDLPVLWAWVVTPGIAIHTAHLMMTDRRVPPNAKG
jgi:integrative and conjugative element protein (TIGR02256 family)